MENQNIKISVKGNLLTIVIDLKKNLGKSASGKSILIATTRGNHHIQDADATLGLNLYKKVGGG